MTDRYQRRALSRRKFAIFELMARPRRFERPTFAFGGQRSIQLSYGRLWASIDQTPVNGNAPPYNKKAFILLAGVCVKAPSAKFGRSNRLGRASNSRAEGVPADFLSAGRVGKRACHYQAIIEGLCS